MQNVNNLFIDNCGLLWYIIGTEQIDSKEERQLLVVVLTTTKERMFTMLPLTTGQVHDLLVNFSHDYPGYNIRSIRASTCYDVVSIHCIDAMGNYRRVEYNVETTVEFVKNEE